MTGKLYGVGVGPGDPELMTLKAVKVIRDSDVIALPGEHPKDTVAWQIAVKVCPEMEEKELLAVPMPMTKDKEKLKESHRQGARIICGGLKTGKQVAFLTLGDPTVYSTYLYMHKIVKNAGYPVEIINGITSFTAVAAKLNMGLAEGGELLHVVPASYQIQDSLELPGTKVLMKAGKRIRDVKQQLKDHNVEVSMIENCGMPEEKIYYGVDEIPEDAGYYSLLIVKEKRR
ncbi:precorrin-2 C(20)-methyltransferase [Blautia liquoris]|uniref:Precorrin-2 C(20)-methyltransferase n=1 Tax=Blautia liquoris TaxID=2779518 RepID=A0A7M2RK87_9FIRM|nr:precorrin-2 C(20)-methyltransferase [Blautia liquoris]QOV19977.1 precorrin-2 C(20)-methyltransferase [Blautia liquoris]